MMISIQSPVEVRMTEQTLRELLKAAEQARTNGYDRAVVRSPYCDADAVIQLDKSGNQESAGFKLRPRKTPTKHERVSEEDFEPPENDFESEYKLEISED